MKKNRFLPILIWFLIIGLRITGPVLAQNSTIDLQLLQVDVSQFPMISFYMESGESNTALLASLSEKTIQVLEDDRNLRPASTLEQYEPGIQVILSYNLGAALAQTTVNGGTRYQAVNESLIRWLTTLPENSADDFSLATNTGLQSIRGKDPIQFSEELTIYDPELMTNRPNLTSLLQSLDLATDPNPNPLMKRVIFYVTPQPNVTNLNAFPGLIDRAVQQDVKVFVWLVAPQSVATSNPVAFDLLTQLADKTGGSFFLYSGQEDLPNPEDYLQSLRKLYRVSYSSGINEPGTHKISVQIERGDNILESKPVNVPISVQAPNLILIDPVLSIDRNWQIVPGTSNESILSPSEENVNFIYEFPDGFVRDLKSVKFLINGEIAAEIISPPFNQFVWNYSDIDTTQVVELAIEVEDILGLKAQSLPALVQITVAEPPLTFWQSLVRFQLSPERWIILVSVLTTGAVLVLAIVMAGKRRSYWRDHSAAREMRTDPLTQPVAIRQEIPRKSPAPSSSYPKINGQPVTAWLVPLNDNFEVIRSKAVPLNQTELIIGRDEQKAGLVIPSPAMAAVHARLTLGGKSGFWLADNGTEAGTWVNFAPISMQGIHLQHGDLVHFAKNAYRFELTNPPEDREPQLISYNE